MSIQASLDDSWKVELEFNCDASDDRYCVLVQRRTRHDVNSLDLSIEARQGTHHAVKVVSAGLSEFVGSIREITPRGPELHKAGPSDGPFAPSVGRSFVPSLSK